MQNGELCMKVSKMIRSTLGYHNEECIHQTFYVGNPINHSDDLCKLSILHRSIYLENIGFSKDEVISILNGENEIEILLKKIDSMFMDNGDCSYSQLSEKCNEIYIEKL
jgi:hypothetical protein